MHILKIGRKYLILDNVIIFDEDVDSDGNPAPDGGISIRTSSGDGYRFSGKEAASLRKFLDSRDVAGNLFGEDSPGPVEVSVDHGGLNLMPQGREGTR